MKSRFFDGGKGGYVDFPNHTHTNTFLRVGLLTKNMRGKSPKKQVSNPAILGKKERIKVIQRTIEKEGYISKEKIINYFAIELGVTTRKIKEYIKQMKKAERIKEVEGEFWEGGEKGETFLAPFDVEEENEKE